MSRATSDRGSGRGVAVYTAVLAVAAVVLTLAVSRALPRDEPVQGQAWLALPVLAVFLVVAGTLHVPFRLRRHTEAMDLFEAVLLPLLLLYPAHVAVPVAAGAKALTERRLGVPAPKMRFNVASWALAAAAGSAVLELVARARGTSVDLLALVAGAVAVAVVNHAAFVGVLRVVERRPLREVLRRLSGVVVPGWVVTGGAVASVGVVLAFAVEASVLAVGVLAAPLLLLHWASHGYAESRVDSARLQALQRATHVLQRPIDPREALPEVLTEVGGLFEVAAADVVLVDDDGHVRRWRWAGGSASGPEQGPEVEVSLGGHLARTGRAGRVVADPPDAGDPAHPADPVLAAALEREGWRDALCAPVVSGERVLGALVTYDRTGLPGFDEGERAVLDALARELAGALVKAELVARVVDERGKLARIVGQASDGILTLDGTGTVRSWNPSMERITGHPAAEVVGRHGMSVLEPCDEDGRPVTPDRWHVDGAPLPSVLRVRTADGAVRWLACSYSAVTDAADGALLVVVARDATTAHELDALREDFVAIAAHELRSPLAPLKGWSTTLLRHHDRLTPEQRTAALSAIASQTSRLEQLVVNLLEVSRVESGVVEPTSPGGVDATAVVGRVVADVAVLAPEREVRVEGADVERWSAGTPAALERIVTNLLTNALKYSPAGAPVDVECTTEDGSVVVAVADRGPGIPPESRERIFDRFARLDSAPTQTGTGLGLYLAKRLAVAMGADVVVDDRPGGGSVFRLVLPARLPDTPAPRAAVPGAVPPVRLPA